MSNALLYSAVDSQSLKWARIRVASLWVCLGCCIMLIAFCSERTESQTPFYNTTQQTASPTLGLHTVISVIYGLRLAGVSSLRVISLVWRRVLLFTGWTDTQWWNLIHSVVLSPGTFFSWHFTVITCFTICSKVFINKINHVWSQN